MRNSAAGAGSYTLVADLLDAEPIELLNTAFVQHGSEPLEKILQVSSGKQMARAESLFWVAGAEALRRPGIAQGRTGASKTLPRPPGSKCHPDLDVQWLWVGGSSMSFLSIVVPVKDERENVRALFERVRDSAYARASGRRNSSLLMMVAVTALSSNWTYLRKPMRGQSCSVAPATSAKVPPPKPDSTPREGDVIVTMDGDLQNDPADIPLMIAKLNEGYDAVLGQPPETPGQTLAAESAEPDGELANSESVGCAVQGFRLHAASGAARSVRRNGFFTANAPVHRTALIMQQGATVTQIPVRHHPRTAGKSKYNLTRTIRVMLDLLTVKFRGAFRLA